VNKRHDIIVLLKKDHRELKRLCAKLKKTGDRALVARRRLFAQLATLLTAHAKAEERAVYAPLKREGGKLRDEVLEGYQEHHVADVLTRELSRLPVDHADWAPKMEVLSEALDHHIEEEETEILPELRELAERERLVRMGRAFLALRAELMNSKPAKLRVARKARKPAVSTRRKEAHHAQARV
jgi:hypothetical protein